MSKVIEAELEYRLGPAAREFSEAQKKFTNALNRVTGEIAQELNVPEMAVLEKATEFMNKLVSS